MEDVKMRLAQEENGNKFFIGKWIFETKEKC